MLVSFTDYYERGNLYIAPYPSSSSTFSMQSDRTWRTSGIETKFRCDCIATRAYLLSGRCALFCLEAEKHLIKELETCRKQDLMVPFFFSFVYSNEHKKRQRELATLTSHSPASIGVKCFVFVTLGICTFALYTRIASFNSLSWLDSSTEIHLRAALNEWKPFRISSGFQQYHSKNGTLITTNSAMIKILGENLNEIKLPYSRMILPANAANSLTSQAFNLALMRLPPGAS